MLVVAYSEYFGGEYIFDPQASTSALLWALISYAAPIAIIPAVPVILIAGFQSWLLENKEREPEKSTEEIVLPAIGNLFAGFWNFLNADPASESAGRYWIRWILLFILVAFGFTAVAIGQLAFEASAPLLFFAGLYLASLGYMVFPGMFLGGVFALATRRWMVGARIMIAVNTVVLVVMIIGSLAR